MDSGFRCVEHNAEIGGVPISIHLFGLALDLSGESDKLYRLINKNYPDLRVGKYEWGCHIDVGYLISPIAKESWRSGARW